jgi:MFS family permease
MTLQPFWRARPGIAVPVIGTTQILAWGSSYYLPAVLAKPIAADTGWPLPWVVGGLSLGFIAAGLASPRIGDGIDRWGGRPILAGSAVLFAAGLAALAVAPNLPVFLASWLVLGLAMGSGLYDAAFATLGRLYGTGARTAIAMVTLFGGFASTVCWPLSAFLLSQFGWRGACLAYAAIHLAIVLPLYLFALPKEEVSAPHARGRGRQGGSALPEGALAPFLLVAAAITVAAIASTIVSVHLLTLLQARGLALAAAVGLGAVIGPSQVAARAVEMLLSRQRQHHPIWTMTVSTLAVALGIALLWSGLPVVAPALVCYGIGVGIGSIARGTLPLALFGQARYAAIIGRIAMPAFIAQAASPALGALLIQWLGESGTLAVLVGIAVIDVALVLALVRLRKAGAD